VAGGGLFFGVILFALYLERRSAAEKELDTALAELDEKEVVWRLQDLEAQRAAVPDVENAALCVLAVRNMLPQQWPKQEFMDTVAHATEDLPPNQQLDEGQVKILRDELEPLEAARAEARRLVILSKGRYPMMYHHDDVTSRNDNEMQQARKVVTLLGYDAILRAQTDTDLSGALQACHAGINVGRSVGDEPNVIPQFIRMACVGVALGKLQRVLAQGQGPDSELAALQAMLESEQQHPYFLLMVLGERALMHEMLCRYETGKESLLERGGQDKSPSIMDRYKEPWERIEVMQDHPSVLRRCTELVTIAREPAEQRAALLAQWDKRPARLSSPMFFLFDGGRHLEESELLVRAHIRCMTVILAMERFRLKLDRWPEDPSDLVPVFLTHLPIDPYDGKPVRVKRADGHWIVYCIGPDRLDNGGMLDPEDVKREGTDVGYCLWDPDQRRRPPKP
jgi:hypothetical protein